MKKSKVYFVFVLLVSVNMMALAQNTSPIGTWEGLDDLNREVYLEIGQRNWNMWINGSFFGSGTYRIGERFTHLILNSGREYGAFIITVGDSLSIQRLESERAFFLFRLSSVDPSGSSGSSQTSSYNPANSSYLMIGYNYAYEAPFGLTLADSMFFNRSLMYISANFGYKSDPGRLDIEWIYGIAIAVNDWLRIPIGIGGNHIGRDGVKVTGSWSSGGSSGNYYDTDPLSDWGHAFVIEAGLHTTIIERFYLSATYRLKGFSKNGFSIGVGIVF
jgi:hypothetical protein